MTTATITASVAVSAQTPKPDAGKPPRFEDLPPAVRLGVRVEAAHRKWATPSTVVIVRDPASYLSAIGSWTAGSRFPVLIDDGTDHARELIARFVRGFGAEHVVRWKADQGGTSEAQGWSEIGAEQVESALADALVGRQPRTAQPLAAPTLSADRLKPFWANNQPPGIIVATQGESAWPSALALAAGRGQPIAWLRVDGGLDDTLSAKQADDFCAAIESAANATGFAWKDLGDFIEAVTICINCPVKVQATATDVVALSDRVGRLGTSAVPKERWAWAGHVIGSPAGSCYMAMCALFMRPSDAWLFDGYPDKQPWNTWDCTQASEHLRKNGFTTIVHDTPKQSAANWRAAAARAVSGGLIFVTTKGNADFFDLEPGLCRPCDVPELAKPSAVYFVHSFSAQWPGRRNTVASRWIERGAYAYMGSVAEPYLQAFIPTQKAAARLLSTAAWGAGVRLDDFRMWKIAVFGDPLITIGKPLRRVGDVPLMGAVNLADQLPEILKEGRFDEAMTTLVLLGRDEDAAKLAAALLKEKPAALAGLAGKAAIPALFRAGFTRDVAGVYAKLDSDSASSPALRDLLWLAAYPLLQESAERPLLETLKANLRDDNLERDATELGAAWQRVFGRQEAIAMLNEVKANQATPEARDAVGRAVSSLGGRK